MIIITGAAGFIGSNLVSGLNSEGYKDLILVDDFSRKDKELNFQGKAYAGKVDRAEFASWLRENQRMTQFVFHLGARTDTTENNRKIFDELNLDYSKRIWEICSEYGIPVVYASSAATYGDGSKGYQDKHELIPSLEPLNEYGRSKNEFDKWVLKQEKKPFFWAGLKFFNVYGPNEYHKGRMASVIFHAYKQIRESGEMKLFRSHKKEYRDGEQLRDFIYVKDVVDVMIWMMESREFPGIYNLGTGKARSFNDLVTAVFNSMDRKTNISYIDTPEDIRDKYQYFTEAEMGKLKSAGYTEEFTPLEDGVNEYVQNYLLAGNYN
jgi:ADP-L-glycero-D-manno-heptose 6-epimerase